MLRASADRKDLKDFEQLFHQLQPRLYAYCCKYIEDNELARDIVQECFINLWENYENVQISYEFYLRLYIIAVYPISAQNVFIRNMRVL